MNKFQKADMIQKQIDELEDRFEVLCEVESLESYTEQECIIDEIRALKAQRSDVLATGKESWSARLAAENID